MRYEDNKKILEILKEEIEQNHNLRFTQILFNLGINEFDNNEYNFKDNYNEEPSRTLAKILKKRGI